MIGVFEARRMFESGADQIQASIYSLRPEVHDAITKLPGSPSPQHRGHPLSH